MNEIIIPYAVLNIRSKADFDRWQFNFKFYEKLKLESLMKVKTT